MEATVTESPDGVIYVVPAGGADTYAVSTALKRHGLAPRRDGRALRVNLGDLDALHGVTGLALTWSDSVRDLVAARRRAQLGREAVAHALEAVADGGVEAARAMLEGVPLIEGLDDHQVENVAAMTVPGGHGMCLFDEQGAGKTVSLIAAFDVLCQRDEVDFMLVLAPKSMVGEWQADFARFTEGVYRVGLFVGSDTERRAVLASRPEVLVTNYEAAVNSEDVLGSVLARYGNRSVLAVDESYHVKNPDALRSQAIRRLRNRAGRAYVLCGTPAPNAADDLVAQVDLVDCGLTFGSVALPDDRAEAVDAVRAVLASRPMLRRNLKADVLPDLPPRAFTRVLLPLAPQQRHIYEHTRDELVDDLRRITDVEYRRELASFAARRSALLRICSHPGAVVDGYTETPAKLDALGDLLDDYVKRRGEKVVVWSFFVHSVGAIEQRFAHLGLVRYDGSVTSVHDRRAAVRSFQEDEGTRVFLGNPAAAGAGLTLHAARIAIYESLSNQAAHFLQSIDRIHRRGQTRDVEYLVLLAEGTIDESEYARLEAKRESARELLGDEDTLPPTREAFLQELLA